MKSGVCSAEMTTPLALKLKDRPCITAVVPQHTPRPIFLKKFFSENI